MCFFSRPKQQTVTPVVASTENRAATYEADMAQLERRRRGGVAANVLTRPNGVSRAKHDKAVKVYRPKGSSGSGHKKPDDFTGHPQPTF